jgi:ribosome recycling factor
MNSFSLSLNEKIKTETDLLLSNLDKQLGKISVGKIDIHIFNNADILINGKVSKLKDIAFLSTINNTSLVIKPYISDNVAVIKDTIQKIFPTMSMSNEKNVCKIYFPQISKEHRQKTIKTVKKVGENFKVQIRNLRRSYNTSLKKYIKNESVSSSFKTNTSSLIEKHITSTTIKIDKILKNKESSILKILLKFNKGE